jgi:hypothetical protein
VELEGPGSELYLQIPFISQIVIGQYELTTDGTNKWHFVTITKKSSLLNDTFTWTNSAGVSWTLIYLDQQDAETLRFTVGQDCPYFNDGYQIAALYINATKGIEIEGPQGELYVRLKKGTSKLFNLFYDHFGFSAS